MPVSSPVLPPDEQLDPLKKIRSRVNQQAQTSLLTPDGPMAPFTPAPPIRVPPRAPNLPKPPIGDPVTTNQQPVSQPNVIDLPDEPPSDNPFPPPGPDPDAPTNPGGPDPLAGIPDDLIRALYGDRNTITDPVAAAQALRDYVEPWKAKNWQRVFELITRGVNPGDALNGGTGFQRQLEQMGYQLIMGADGKWHGKITTPGGQGVDVIYAANSGDPGQMRWQWLAGDGGGGGQAPIGDYNQKIRDLILKRIGELNFDPDSPQIQQIMAVNERDQERIREQKRAAMAERRAQEGLNSGGQGSGAFDVDVLAGYEDKGNTLSRIRNSVVSEQYQQLRQEYTQLMQLAMQAGDSEAARELQAWWYGIQLALEQNRQNQPPV